MMAQRGRLHCERARVLIISDEQLTAEVWSYSLSRLGLDVTLVGITDPIIEKFVETTPDLIIIEDFNKDIEEIELCKRLRGESVAPILYLTGKTDEAFQLQVYEVGADECITFPITPRLFQVKVKAWLRRTMSIPFSILNEIELDRLRLDVDKRILNLPTGDRVKLTNLESRLLYLFMSYPGRVFEVDEIVNKVWGYWGEGDGTLLKNLVYRLRRKIEPNPNQPRHIVTVEGSGYGFRVD